MGERSLHGQVALVTGASRGIGRAVALELARLGATIVVVARTGSPHEELPGTVWSTVADIEAVGGTAFGIKADLLEPGVPSQVVTATLDRFGRLDILVNNAADTGQAVFKTLQDLEPEAWRSSIELNLNVPWELMKWSADWMRTNGRGLIVNVTSSAGILPDGPTPAAGEVGWIGAVYGTSKAALNQVSRLLGGELLPLGVVVVAFDPGLTRTEAAELTAAKSGFDISGAHPMEPVARALGLLATSNDLTSYAGRFMPFDQILEREGEQTDDASQA